MASVSRVRRPFSLPHSPTFWPLHRYSWFSSQTKENEKEGNIVICYNVELKSIRICAANNLKFDRVYCISLRRKLQTSVEESCLLPGGKTPLKASTECWTTPVNIRKTEIIRNTWTFMFLTVFLCFASLLPSLQLHASALLRYKRMHIYLYSFLSVISLCPISN